MNEEIKLLIVDIVMGAGVGSLRFRANTMRGVGVSFEATKLQYEKIEAGLIEAGLEPSLQGVNEVQASKMEPTYAYALFVYVPSGWKATKND